MSSDRTMWVRGGRKSNDKRDMCEGGWAGVDSHYLSVGCIKALRARPRGLWRWRGGVRQEQHEVLQEDRIWICVYTVEDVTETPQVCCSSSKCKGGVRSTSTSCGACRDCARWDPRSLTWSPRPRHFCNSRGNLSHFESDTLIGSRLPARGSGRAEHPALEAMQCLMRGYRGNRYAKTSTLCPH